MHSRYVVDKYGMSHMSPTLLSERRMAFIVAICICTSPVKARVYSRKLLSLKVPINPTDSTLARQP